MLKGKVVAMGRFWRKHLISVKSIKPIWNPSRRQSSRNKQEPGGSPLCSVSQSALLFLKGFMFALQVDGVERLGLIWALDGRYLY